MDNYNSFGPVITYGSGVPNNGVSGAASTPGTGLNGSWTAQIYWAVGTVAGDATSGNGSISSLLTAGSGSGSSAVFFTSTFSTLGEFLAGSTFVIPGTGTGTTISFEIAAWATSAGSYANSLYRGHSAVFTTTTSAASNPSPASIGNAFTTFNVTPVTPVPEPTTLALAGLGGLASLVMLRRKNA